MMAGAALEARSPGSYAVGKSLERGQGGDRLMLETYRRQARASIEVERKTERPEQPSYSLSTDPQVLRQKFSVPLNRLVQPAGLAEWTNAPANVQSSVAPPPNSTEQHATNSSQAPLGDPFADDPQPPTSKEGTADPSDIVGDQAEGTEAAQPTGKIPSGKLLGILGRALRQSAPLPPLDQLREKLPDVPIAGAGNPPEDTGADFGTDTEASPIEDDPFSDPGPGAGEDEGSNSPTDAAEEDPFGGF
jgi:hypothetical protein